MTTTQPRVIATGELVRLREKQIEDAERDYAWRRDPELASYDAARPLTMKFSNFVATMTEEIQYPAAHRRTFAIDDLDTGTHIGNVMYYGYDPAVGEAEIGITIGERPYWSRGYGTETVRLITQYLFDAMRVRRVFLHTLTWNHRAQECFQRAGFRRVKTVTRGGYDFVYMEILASNTPEAPA